MDIKMYSNIGFDVSKSRVLLTAGFFRTIKSMSHIYFRIALCTVKERNVYLRAVDFVPFSVLTHLSSLGLEKYLSEMAWYLVLLLY